MQQISIERHPGRITEEPLFYKPIEADHLKFFASKAHSEIYNTHLKANRGKMHKIVFIFVDYTVDITLFKL